MKIFGVKFDTFELLMLGFMLCLGALSVYAALSDDDVPLADQINCRSVCKDTADSGKGYGVCMRECTDALSGEAQP